MPMQFGSVSAGRGWGNPYEEVARMLAEIMRGGFQVRAPRETEVGPFPGHSMPNPVQDPQGVRTPKGNQTPPPRGLMDPQPYGPGWGLDPEGNPNSIYGGNANRLAFEGYPAYAGMGGGFGGNFGGGPSGFSGPMGM